MKLKNILLSCMLFAGLTATAQEQEPQTVYDFQPHWNVFIQTLGAQYTVGEVDFNDLVSYNFQVGGGYQFTPVFGARLSVNAYQSKAGWKIRHIESKWKWNYVAPMADVTVNLCNLFGGYKPTRIFNLGIFAGIGANIAWNNDEAAEATYMYTVGYEHDLMVQNLNYLWSGTKVRLAGRFGATADFRISDRWSIGLEVQANTLSDKYNSKDADNLDWYINGLIGVKFNIGKTYTKRTVSPATIIQIQERLVRDTVYIEVPTEVPAQAKTAESNAVGAAEVVEPLRRDIFFTISSVVIPKAEMKKVEEIAAYMKKYPASTITITGYADKGTGNPKINKRLSVNRANTVANALIKQYGISASRIKTDSKGDTVQPYEKEELNRVSICIAE